MRTLNAGMWLTLGVIGLGVSTAQGTWSIIITDSETKEVAIGSATCLQNFDLQRYLPVVKPLVGAAAAQSSVDVSAQNRRLIWDEMEVGTDPAEILVLLQAQDPSHQTRQYGIVDTLGRAVTFSGAANGQYKNGLTGKIGSLTYSIQGNVITGQAVLDEAEAALLSTPGGLPEKLMAAMEAARAMGGDGRCSCLTGAPNSCGAPPESFEKAAHVGFVIVARRGDGHGRCILSKGCATADYYLELNIPDAGAADPDPVFTLRQQFDAWRTALLGVADAIESTVSLDQYRVLNDGQATVTMTIELVDWQGTPVTSIPDLIVDHDPMGSAGSSVIGAPVSLGGGVWQVELSAATVNGLDQFRIRIPYDGREVILMPAPVLAVQDARADLNEDGVVDLGDLQTLLASFEDSDGGDIDGDGETNLTDLALLLAVPGLT